jgi:hypothetical protein
MSEDNEQPLKKARIEGSAGGSSGDQEKEDDAGEQEKVAVSDAGSGAGGSSGNQEKEDDGAGGSAGAVAVAVAVAVSDAGSGAGGGAGAGGSAGAGAGAGAGDNVDFGNRLVFEYLSFYWNGRNWIHFPGKIVLIFASTHTLTTVLLFCRRLWSKHLSAFICKS